MKQSFGKTLFGKTLLRKPLLLLGAKVAHFAAKQLMSSDLISKSEANRLLTEWRDSVRDRVVHELSAWVGSDNVVNDRHATDLAPEIAQARIIREPRTRTSESQPTNKREDISQTSESPNIATNGNTSHQVTQSKPKQPATHSNSINKKNKDAQKTRNISPSLNDVEAVVSSPSPPFVTDTLKGIYQKQGRKLETIDSNHVSTRSEQGRRDTSTVQSPTTQSAIQEVTFENQSTQPRSDQSTQAQARQSRSTTSLECDKRDTYFLLRWKVSDRKLGKIIPSDVNTEDERPVLILRQITFWLSGASPSIDDHPIFTMSEDREWTGEINRRLPKQPWASVAFSIGVLERLAQETRAKDTRPTPPGGQNFRSLAHIIVER